MALTINERVSLLVKGITVCKYLRGRAPISTLISVAVPLRMTFYVVRAAILAILWRMNIRNTIACGFIQAAFATLSPRQIQHVVPSTREAYQRFLRQKAREHPSGTLDVSFTPKIEPLDESGAALLWLGNRQKATKIVYFLHGGGFFVPLAPGHLRWCWDLYIKPSAAAGIDVACAILEYTLAPKAKYPSHLKQASMGLQAILDTGVSARDIIIGGDSAGGNLTMQLLMHILHPHPQVAPLTLDAQLPAAFLVSPYLTFRAAHQQSFEKYLSVDMSPGRSRVDSLQYEVSGTDNPIPEMETKYWWGTPLDADSSRYHGISDIVRHMYITYGEHEVLLDHSTKLIELLRELAPELNLVAEAGYKESHDAVLLEEMTRQFEGPASTRLQRWFTKLLEGDFDMPAKTQEQ